jgi:hypothetical protein
LYTSFNKPMPLGRPTLYSDALCEEIVKNCRKGQGSGTNKEIAAFCCVNESTVWRWKKEHPELEAAIEQAVSCNCDLVEATLLHLAITGDMAAIQFYLKNHRPDKWREKQEIDLRTPDGIQVEYSVDEILKLLHLPQEKKLSLARKHRECLEELRECTLLPEAAIDVETGE